MAARKLKKRRREHGRVLDPRSYQLVVYWSDEDQNRTALVQSLVVPGLR